MHDRKFRFGVIVPKVGSATEFTEIHMVNGENPHVGFDFYVETIGKLHDAFPDVFLKCYTASEIHHMTTLSRLTHEQVLRELQAVGLGALTGGGAEVFSDRVRRLVAPGKEHPDIWFHVHDTAHRLGIPTHCTLLYGHVETYEERIEHLLRLREQHHPAVGGDQSAIDGGMILNGGKPADPPVEGKKNDPMMPVAWVKTYKTDSGKTGRVFTTTMGASQDLQSEGLRRLLVNACYWAVGLEDKIPAKAIVDIVGEYKPRPFGFGSFEKGRKPADYASR